MWELEYLPEAKEDLRRLDNSQRLRVAKALEKVRANPQSSDEGGFGKPLGNKRVSQLSGLMKIKLKNEGIRIVYKLERTESCMRVIVIGARSDNEVYREAVKRRQSYGL
ncbi:MAG: type II toxin-antitoxin system RelE/ParE family toxin [Gordonibacter sp.]|uniref:type II toxin-antitoxin system RelE family toxin n=1 Tax=Gordonibacter sp. TaxID=1968902 RepID=UPI002FC7D21E